MSVIVVRPVAGPTVVIQTVPAPVVVVRSGATIVVNEPVPPVIVARPLPAPAVVVRFPGPPGLDAGTRLTRIAAVTLSGQRLVTSRDDGTVEYADYATVGHLHRQFWLTLNAAVAGDPVDLLAFGDVDEPTWSWAPGELVYLGSNGVLTQTPPTDPPALFIAVVATALTATSLFMCPRLTVVLT